MSNMGYCRFENTASDLRDCCEWLHENEPDKLSESERKAFNRMIKMCVDIVDNYGDQP